MPKALLATVAITALTVIAACNGGGDGANGPAGAGAAATANEIAVEPLPEVLPEPFIFRGEGVELQEEQARQEILYTVSPGDTLQLIAQVFGVSTAQIQRINGIADPSVLRAGDELRIPVLPGTEAERIAASLDQPEEDFAGPPPGEQYVIGPGDTLVDIGVRVGIDWQELQRYNRLSEFEANNLVVGNTLVIPPPEDEEEAGPTEPPG